MYIKKIRSPELQSTDMLTGSGTLAGLGDIECCGISEEKGHYLLCFMTT